MKVGPFTVPQRTPLRDGQPEPLSTCQLPGGPSPPDTAWASRFTVAASLVVQPSPGSATRATARVHAPLPPSTLIGNARMVAPVAGTAVRLASFSICR